MPLERIRFRPAPGTATEADVLAAEGSIDKRLCELIDGVLVEKAMGFTESVLALYLARKLAEFVERRNLGVVAAADGMVRLMQGNVRIPDVAFVSWDRLPGRRVPNEPIPDLGPDLAIEVLSPSNTRREMERKRREYFGSGVRLVWEIDPRSKSVNVFSSPDDAKSLARSDALEGGDVLPGFSLPVADLFSQLERHG
ncbi:MAG: Uma2 family endonuclease [Planctomycetia bacterium]|nr:Uma2 family endonuclease [Planctomycetia bacterium]